MRTRRRGYDTALCARMGGSKPDADSTEGALSALARLHFRENEWDLKEWWQTRPDDRGPYCKPTGWEGTAKIRAANETHFAKVPGTRRGAFISLFAYNRIPVGARKGPCLGSSGAIELRDMAGQVTGIKRSEVKEEKTLPQFMMPPASAIPSPSAISPSSSNTLSP